MELKRSVTHKVQAVVKKLFDLDVDVELTIPEEQFGDFSTNAAMQLARRLGANPRELAQQIADELRADFKAVEVAGPGFINLTVSDVQLLSQLTATPEQPYKGQSWVVEYSCPNYFKELHAGHLYQTLIGDSLAKLIERAGATVHRTNFGADVGLSAARAIWGILQDLGGEYPEKLADIPLEKRTKYIAERYVDGAQADTSEDADQSAEILAVNKRIYQMHAEGDTESSFAKVYYTCRDWCKDYFLSLYTILRVDEFEKYYPESSTEKRGVSTVREYLEKGVFIESQGAVVFEGEPYGLHTRVFITKENLPTYEAKDLGLILIEMEEFAFDRRVLVTGREQQEYMKVVWKATDLVLPGVEAKMTHPTNGLIKFGDGKKMSSRLGNVTSAVDVINTVRGLVDASDDKERNERIALGAVKYEFLKHKLGGDIAFDPEESVSLQGNSGPYLQYALVRARSVLAKSEMRSTASNLQLGERSLVRKLGQFEQAVWSATHELQTHVLCTYLYELATTFNKFYESNRVIGDDREAERLTLVAAYAETLSVGLGLLGIQVPDKM